MSKELLDNIFNNEKLDDIPILHILKVLSAIEEAELNDERTTKIERIRISKTIY